MRLKPFCLEWICPTNGPYFVQEEAFG